jgi:antitoxin (DNA-binding transcriptional repressor) of toxin-antitoxin stability system
MIKTYKSDEARLKMRDILDDVTAGRESVIERYNKPVAVVVPHALWQSIKRKRKAELDAISKRMDEGEYYTMEQVEAMLKQDGILP